MERARRNVRRLSGKRWLLSSQLGYDLNQALMRIGIPTEQIQDERTDDGLAFRLGFKLLQVVLQLDLKPRPVVPDQCGEFRPQRVNRLF